MIMTKTTIHAVANDPAVIRAILKAAESEHPVLGSSFASAINAAAAIVSTMMGECDLVQPVLKAIDGEEFLRRNPGFVARL